MLVDIISLEMPYNLVIKKSSITNAGKGVFATQDIPGKQFLGSYRGRYITKREHACLKNCIYVFQADDQGEVFIDASDENFCNWTKYINGARTPKEFEKINIKIKTQFPYVLLYSSKYIMQGDELIYDYGPDYNLWDTEIKHYTQKTLFDYFG